MFDKATFIRTRVNHLFTYPQYWSSNLYRASSITIIYQIIGSAIDAADCLIAIELADRLSDCSAGNHFRLTTILISLVDKGILCIHTCYLVTVQTECNICTPLKIPIGYIYRVQCKFKTFILHGAYIRPLSCCSTIARSSHISRIILLQQEVSCLFDICIQNKLDAVIKKVQVDTCIPGTGTLPCQIGISNIGGLQTRPPDRLHIRSHPLVSKCTDIGITDFTITQTQLEVINHIFQRTPE